MTDWIVKGLIPQGDSVFSLGYPHAGKSWIMNQLATAVATGKNLFFTESFETKQCSVILIDEDTPTNLLSNRMERVTTSFGVNSEVIDIRSMTGWRLDRNVSVLLEEVKRKMQPVLILIESLSKVMPPNWDANSTQDAVKAVRLLNRLRSAATVVTSHHISEKKEYKFGDPGFDRKAMGNTQLNAGCDTIFGVTELSSFPTIFGIHPKSKRTAIEEHPFAVELKEDPQRTWAYLKLLEDIPGGAFLSFRLAKIIAPILYKNKTCNIETFYKETKHLLSEQDARMGFNYLVEINFAHLNGHEYTLNSDMKSQFSLLSSVQEELIEYCEVRMKEKSKKLGKLSE